MARDSKDQQLIELKDTIKELNTTIRNLNALIDAANKREEEHLQKEQVLQEQIDYLTKKPFGKSSEKRNDDFEGQLNLFNEAEAEKTAPDPEEEDFVTVEKHTRKRKSTMADKFAGFADCRRGANDTMIITKGTNAFISAWVQKTVDMGTHTVFYAQVTDMEVLSDTPSATYEYYQSNIKPKPEAVGKTQDGQTIWRCRICGYEYVGEEVPDDFICPTCKHGKQDFEKVV